jgi:hypothetical protein
MIKWRSFKPPQMRMRAASIALASIAILFLVGAMADTDTSSAEGAVEQLKTTQGSTLSPKGAASKHNMPGHKRARRNARGRPGNRKDKKPTKAERRANRAARKAEKDAETSARRSKLAAMTETLGKDAANAALRREAKEAKEAKKTAAREAHRAEKRAKKAEKKTRRDQKRTKRRADARKSRRTLGGGFAALHPDFVAKTLPEPVHKTAQCQGSTAGLYTESIAGNNTRYYRCHRLYDEFMDEEDEDFYNMGPDGEGYYPGSHPNPFVDECWAGIAREEPIPGNLVTVDTAYTEWMVFSPVNPNIVYFMTWDLRMEIKMMDLSTPDMMITHIAGANFGASPSDTRHPEVQGCFVDVFNVSEDTNNTEHLQWRYTYRSYSHVDNSSDDALGDGEVFEAGIDYNFFNATVSPVNCSTVDEDDVDMEDTLPLLPAPAKHWFWGNDADWYSAGVLTSDGEIMYLMFEGDDSDFWGILALNLTSGNMSEVVNFWSDENYGSPWYNDNDAMEMGTMQLSHDDSTMYILTDADWADCRECDNEVWSLNLVTGEFRMIFDVYANLNTYYYLPSPMSLSPDGKKMWFSDDCDNCEAMVGYMNMDDFSGSVVYDRYNEWYDYDYAGPSIYFESYYVSGGMTPDSKNFVIMDEYENNVLIMPTTPPYNMHSVIGFGNYAMPSMWSSEWEDGGEITVACPDRTCDGPVGFANWDYESIGVVSPDGSFILAVEDDSSQGKFRKIHIDNRCKVATCG